MRRASDVQAGGLSIRELERKRDDCLVAILHALKEQNWGAGTTLTDMKGFWRIGCVKPTPKAGVDLSHARFDRRHGPEIVAAIAAARSPNKVLY